MTIRCIVLVFGDVVVELVSGISEWLVGSGCLLWCPCSPGLSGAPLAPQFFSCSLRCKGIILCILRLWLGDGSGAMFGVAALRSEVLVGVSGFGVEVSVDDASI